MPTSWIPFCTAPTKLSLREVTARLESSSLLVTGESSPSALELWNKFAAPYRSFSACSPLIAAGQDLARSIDRGIGAGKAQDLYHATPHFKEVLMNAGALLWIAEKKYGKTFTHKENLSLLFSALGHDYHHDGGTNGTEPLRLEKRSVQGLMTHMADHDVDIHTRESVWLMTLSTDVSRSPDYVNALLAGQLPPPPAGYEMLAELALPEHAQTAQLAAMLRDADILAASGLTFKTASRCERSLGREWNKLMTPQDHEDFLNMIVAQPDAKGRRIVGFCSPAGQFFNPNIGKVTAAIKKSWSHREHPRRRFASPI